MSDRDWAAELVGRLTALAEPDSPNRAALAHLRRGLCGPPDYTLARVGWLFSTVPNSALDHAVLAAGLFAWVRGRCGQAPGVNFGAAFGAGLTVEQKQRRERRFIDLLDTDADDLPYKLRQALTLVEGAGLDWALLVRHLAQWGHPDRWVQRDWARGFWAAPEPTASQATTH